MSKWSVTRTYTINLPNRQTEAFDHILNVIDEDAPEWFPRQDWETDFKAGTLTQHDIDEMEEEMMATYIAQSIDVGNLNEFGEIEDEVTEKVE
jgi:hypothetical protein